MARSTPDHIFRAAGPVATAALGLLADLPGVWRGRGFNLIARPARQGDENNPVFFLELNATIETLRFEAIGGDIPNRGDVEPTILIRGLHYLQSIVDANDGSALHLEPGVWIHLPAPDESYVRQGTVPHGTSFVAVSGSAGTIPSGPNLDPVISIPFPIADPIPPLNDTTHAVETDPTYLAPYLNDPLPVGLPAGLVAADTIHDPVGVLRAQIVGQIITETKIIEISTSYHSPNSASPAVEGIANIPFVAANAAAARMDAIFWIETVNNPTIHGQSFLQLQIVQRVILDFEGLHWPHVQVATLVKAA